MKTISVIFALLLGLSNATFASGKEENTKVSVNKPAAILSPEQENLFMSGNLSDKTFRPIYTSVEQIIFTEQVKIVKSNN